MGTKNLKGSVSIENIAGRLRLRWRYQSKRYSLNLFSYSKVNLLQAKKTARTIENDMVVGDFDFSLRKYGKNEAETKTKKKSIVEYFEYWTRTYRNMDCDSHVHYHATRNMMLRWGRQPEAKPSEPTMYQFIVCLLSLPLTRFSPCRRTYTKIAKILPSKLLQIPYLKNLDIKRLIS